MLPDKQVLVWLHLQHFLRASTVSEMCESFLLYLTISVTVNILNHFDALQAQQFHCQ